MEQFRKKENILKFNKFSQINFQYHETSRQKETHLTIQNNNYSNHIDNSTKKFANVPRYHCYVCLLRHQNLFYRDFMLLESKGKVYLLIIFIFSSVVVFFDFCLSSILPKGNFRRLNAHPAIILFVRVVVKPFFIDVVQILPRKSLNKYLPAMEVLHKNLN